MLCCISIYSNGAIFHYRFPGVLDTLEKLPVNFRLFESIRKEEILSSRYNVTRGSGRRSRTTSETSVNSANVNWTPDKKLTSATSSSACKIGTAAKDDGTVTTPTQQQQPQQATSYCTQPPASMALAASPAVAMISRKKRDSEGEMPVMFEFQEDLMDEDGETVEEMTLRKWIDGNTEKELHVYINSCEKGLEQVR